MILGNEFTELKEAISGSGTMRIRIIGPGHGSSGYYPAKVLENAAPKYKSGTHMYLNHSTKSEMRERPERSVSDLAGYLISDGKYQNHGTYGPGIYAECKILDKYRDFIREASPVIGISHHASGATKTGEVDGRRCTIVESIDEVFSVDVVTRAGARGAFLESDRPGASGSLSCLEEADEALIASYVQSGMQESTARFIVGRMGGGNDSPGYLEHQQAPGPVPGITGLSEADEILVRSYIESGMREDTARKIVANLTG